MVATTAPRIQRSGSVSYVLFPPVHLAVVANVLGPEKVRPMTASQARGAIVSPGTHIGPVLDGPMFRNCAGQTLPAGNASYAQSTCSNPGWRLLDTTRGIDMQGYDPRRTRGITFSVVGDTASAADGPTVAPSARVAVQCYPPLVRRRAVVASPNIDENRQWRAGMGVTNTGQIMLAVGTGSMFDFASAMLRLGCVDAGYTDGGGSARLEVGSEKAGAGENRPVAVWIAGVFANEGPSAPTDDSRPGDAPAPTSDGKRILAVAGTILAAVLGALWWRK